MLQGKIWGATKELLVTPFVEVHEITILPYMQCSLHMHEFKYNMFYVISGKLFIEAHKNDYDLVDVTVLKAGDYTSVPPTEYHKFVTEDEPVVALEIYYPKGIQHDIVRKNCGGATE